MLAFKSQVNIKKQAKIEKYDLDYSKVEQAKKIIPFDVREMYVPR